MESSHIVLVVVKSIGAYPGGAQLYQFRFGGVGARDLQARPLCWTFTRLLPPELGGNILLFKLG